MALVVTARSPVEAQPGLGAPTCAPQTQPLSRLQVGLRWLALGGAAWYGLGLVSNNLARTTSLEFAAQLVTASGMGLTLAVCVVAWLARRDAAGLLLAATLAPLLAAARAVSTGPPETLRPADVAGGA